MLRCFECGGFLLPRATDNKIIIESVRSWEGRRGRFRGSYSQWAGYLSRLARRPKSKRVVWWPTGTKVLGTRQSHKALYQRWRTRAHRRRGRARAPPPPRPARAQIRRCKRPTSTTRRRKLRRRRIRPEASATSRTRKRRRRRPETTTPSGRPPPIGTEVTLAISYL